MNKLFIDRAIRITAFNFTTSDFTSVTYKKEIQYIFNMFFFPKFDLRKTLNNFDKDSINRLIIDLKTESYENFEKIHSYPLRGVGPGETTLFFLLNNVYLGGGSSAGVDLADTSGNKYEVKAVKINSSRIASDFKLGGTVPLFNIIDQISKLKDDLKLGGTKTEISGQIIQQLRSKKQEEFKMIEQMYSKVAGDYFKGHKVIFINNTTNRQSRGLVEEVTEIRPDQIMIERVTSGTIKPLIQL